MRHKYARRPVREANRPMFQLFSPAILLLPQNTISDQKITKLAIPHHKDDPNDIPRNIPREIKMILEIGIIETHIMKRASISPVIIATIGWVNRAIENSKIATKTGIKTFSVKL